MQLHQGSSVAGNPAGLIGPNSIIRIAQATRESFGEPETGRLFDAAGLACYLKVLPEHMVHEDEVTALHHQLREQLGAESAQRISRRAGELTGDYLLANRIPRAAQAVLRVLPPPLASRALLAAIRRNAWTFAGSGIFTAQAGNPTRVSIAGCAICRGARSTEPVCDYYSATFERLFSKLVSSRAAAVETACEAAGAPACVFEIAW